MSSELRFDVYKVGVLPDCFYMERLVSNVALLPAVILAGIEEIDFTESMANTGWVGTCPQWTQFLPIVTIPHGTRLNLEQLEFMTELGG